MQLAFIIGLSYTWLNILPIIHILRMSGEVDWNYLVVDLRLGLLYPPPAPACYLSRK